MISAVVAMSKNNVIGDSNDLPWYLPADLKHFKEVTTGHTVIMGRKTWESIFDRLGKPLPNRTNVVVTRDHDFSAEGVEIVHNLELVAQNYPDSYVIGGAEIFKQLLPNIDRIYLTEVDTELTGDAYFPLLDDSEWTEASRESHPADEMNEYPYSFVVLDRNHANSR